MQVFKCTEVEGEWWLVADMRLKCYDGDWYFYATYAFVMGVLFTAGFPLTILLILLKNRNSLEDPTVVGRWGFLYSVRLRLGSSLRRPLRTGTLGLFEGTRRTPLVSPFTRRLSSSFQLYI